MKKPEKCRYPTSSGECRFGKKTCKGCAWDEEEDRRQKSLPIIRDEETGLYRKVVGTKTGETSK